MNVTLFLAARPANPPPAQGQKSVRSRYTASRAARGDEAAFPGGSRNGSWRLWGLRKPKSGPEPAKLLRSLLLQTLSIHACLRLRFAPFQRPRVVPYNRGDCSGPWSGVDASSVSCHARRHGRPSKVATSATGLGVRTGVDIDLDPRGNVLVNGKGMSVSPDWRHVPLFRIPERLRHLKQGARGPNKNSCFRYGIGTFERGHFAAGLTLEPDTPTHGTIAPAAPVPLSDYGDALAATRSGWEKDER